MDIEKFPNKRKTPTPSTKNKHQDESKEITEDTSESVRKNKERAAARKSRLNKTQLKWHKQSVHREDKLKESRKIINYKQRKISKTLSYSIINEHIKQRDTKSLISSYIRVNEVSSCISNISTSTQLPTVTPNKSDEFKKSFHI